VFPIPVLFAYHQPNDTAAPKHAAVRSAEAAAVSGIDNTFAHLTELGNVTAHNNITAVMRCLAEVIEREAPAGLHRDLAIVAAGLARNAANEAVYDSVGRGRLLAIAKTKLQEARWLACTVIACGGL
jgi:hypothetical protein